MDTPESDRLLRLEARVAALEARLRAAGGAPTVEPRATPFAPPPVVERPRAVPPPLPPPLPPRPPDPPAAGPPPAKATSDLERFVGLAVLGRIGVAAVVIAAAYFGQLGWSQLGPGARVFCIYVGAAAMLATGLALRARARVAPRYVALLFGGAVALTYVAGALAKLRYDLIGGDLAMVLLVGSAALGQVLGRLLRLEAMATVALAGGYAAPVLVGQPSSSPTVFVVYLLGLHTWAAWTQHRWNWSWARRLAVVATALLGSAWFLTNPLTPATSVVLHVQGILLGLAAPEGIAAFARRHVPHGRWLAVVLGAWAVQVVLLAWTMAHGTVAPLGVVAGAALLGLGVALRQRGAEMPGQAIDLSRLGGTVLAVGALACWNVPTDPLLLIASNFDQPWPRLLTLLGAGGLVHALRRWSGTGDPALAVATGLVVCLVLQQSAGDERRLLVAAAMLLPLGSLAWMRHAEPAALALVAGALLSFCGLAEALACRGAAGSWLAAAFLAAGGWCALGTYAASRRQDAQLQVVAAVLLTVLGVVWCVAAAYDWPLIDNMRPHEMLPFVVNLRFLAALAMLAALLGAFELSRRRPLERAAPAVFVLFGITALAIAYLAGLAEMLGLVHDWPYGWSAVTISLYTLLFAAGLLVAGFVGKNPLLRWPGLCGFCIVVIKVAVWDLREVDTPLRMLVSGALGFVLLLGSYAYARARKHASQP